MGGHALSQRPAPTRPRLALLAVLPLLVDLLVLLLDHRKQLLLLVQQPLLLHLLFLDHLQQDGVVQHLRPAGFWRGDSTVGACPVRTGAVPGQGRCDAWRQPRSPAGPSPGHPSLAWAHVGPQQGPSCSDCCPGINAEKPHRRSELPWP